jgi:hypothetical protein
MVTIVRVSRVYWLTVVYDISILKTNFANVDLEKKKPWVFQSDKINDIYSNLTNVMNIYTYLHVYLKKNHVLQ